MRTLVLLLLICIVPAAYGQAGEHLTLFKSTVDTNCESLLARIERLAIATSQTPAAHAYFVMHPGPDPIKNFFYARFLKGYFATKKLDEKRNLVIITEATAKLSFEFWISKDGETKPVAEVKRLSITLDPNTTHIFADDLLEVVKLDGKYTYYGYCSVCCSEMVDLGILAAFLEENPGLNARISITANSRATASRLTSLLRAEAVNNGIADGRLAIIYKGRDKNLMNLSRTFASVVIKLVPR